jgi:hypothetical protein
MFSFIIPSGLLECQLDIGRQRQQRMCEMKSGMMTYHRHCEEPTGRANARPMTGSATKQSSLRRFMDCFADAQ